MKKIILTGAPYSTNNIYFSSPTKKTGIRFMGKAAKDKKTQYQWEAKSQWKDGILEEDLMIVVKLYFKDKRKRDWDNYHKLSMDALTGIVWKDDSQIVYATVSKHIDKNSPRIEIEVARTLAV
jgi:crossover junction endodeoxyribonuclease RusA